MNAHALSAVDVSRKTLRQHVYEELRATIISGDILPGQSLTLRELAERYAVSIVPVREALFQLAAEGVVVQRNNIDYRVSTLSPREFLEVYRVRRMVELEIARESIRIRPARAVEELETVMNEMCALVVRPKEYVRCNQLFHFTIYSFADMPVLMRIIQNLWMRIGPYLSIHMELHEDLRSSLAIHEKMLLAYREGREAAFLELLGQDLSEACVELGPLVETLHVSGGKAFREQILSRLLSRREQRIS